MFSRRLGLGLAIGAAALLALAYVSIDVSTCESGHDVHRGDKLYKLCDLADDLLSKAPSDAATERFSWRLQDGEQIGYSELEYRSKRPPEEIRQALRGFLKDAGLRPDRKDDDGFEWWTDKHTSFGFIVRSDNDGHSAVELVHAGL